MLLEQASRLCTKPLYRNRCALLLKHQTMCWTFMSDRRVPLTNNEAERSLRSYVLRRKGSYGVRSHRGELFRQRILTLVDTCRKQNANALLVLRTIIHAIRSKLPYPSLNELLALSQ